MYSTEALNDPRRKVLTLEERTTKFKSVLERAESGFRAYEILVARSATKAKEYIFG